MKCLDRYEKYCDESLDTVMLLIRNGTIKSGRYAHLVKVDKNKEMKGKEFFKNGKEND